MADQDKITLNLDVAEREQVQPKYQREPFTVVVAGQKITMTDPSNLTWQETLLIEQPGDFIRYCVNDEDKEIFAQTPLEAWKMRLLIERFQRHYGLDKLGNASASRGF